MWNKAQGVGLIALIVSLIFFSGVYHAVDSAAEEHAFSRPVTSSVAVGDLIQNQPSEGCLQRPIEVLEIVDQEKIPFYGLGLSALSCQKPSRYLRFADEFGSLDFLRARDLNVLYHNLRI